MQFYPEKCLLCGACVQVCPEGAQQIENGKRVYDREKCVRCGACVEECFSRALVQNGKEMDVQDALAEVLKDRPYYEDSGGGVTISGGEPLLQADFTRALLAACQQAGCHTALDTAGNLPWEVIDSVLPVTNLVLYDFKVLDDSRHRQFTGVSNGRILANLRRLSESGKEVWVRIPVIPGVNDTLQEITEMAGYLAKTPGVSLVELLPFHHLGSGKYESLGQAYPSSGLKPPPAEQMQALVTAAAAQGINVRRMV